MRVGLVVPHIFLHQDILPRVIFSPGQLALSLADGLSSEDVGVVLFSPGPVDTRAQNITADLSYFEQELAGRGDSYLDLLKKHPFTFVTLARQVQSEIIARAFAMANNNELDIVHIYTSEEDIALPFAALCKKPVVFTHHDPFNFLVKYKNVFPKYRHLNWLSMSYAQRQSMPPGTNWVGNIYHGLKKDRFAPVAEPAGDYVAYLGRIVKPKGLHLAIAAVREYNKTATKPTKLKIAGKHYAGHKDEYWQHIAPLLDGDIEYVGYLSEDQEKQDFLANARALVIPSTFEEPFGMVMIEALACGTPLIGVDSGAISEVITSTNGILVEKNDEATMITDLARAMESVGGISRDACRKDFESKYTLQRMCREHAEVYKKL